MYTCGEEFGKVGVSTLVYQAENTIAPEGRFIEAASVDFKRHPQ